VDPGGLPIGRNPDDYPLHLAVREQDVDAWEAFFEPFDLPTAIGREPGDGVNGRLQIVDVSSENDLFEQT